MPTTSTFSSEKMYYSSEPRSVHMAPHGSKHRPESETQCCKPFQSPGQKPSREPSPAQGRPSTFGKKHVTWCLGPEDKPGELQAQKADQDQGQYEASKPKRPDFDRDEMSMAAPRRDDKEDHSKWMDGQYFPYPGSSLPMRPSQMPEFEPAQAPLQFPNTAKYYPPPVVSSTKRGAPPFPLFATLVINPEEASTCSLDRDQGRTNAKPPSCLKKHVTWSMDSSRDEFVCEHRPEHKPNQNEESYGKRSEFLRDETFSGMPRKNEREMQSNFPRRLGPNQSCPVGSGVHPVSRKDADESMKRKCDSIEKKLNKVLTRVLTRSLENKIHQGMRTQLQRDWEENLYEFPAKRSSQEYETAKAKNQKSSKSFNRNRSVSSARKPPTNLKQKENLENKSGRKAARPQNARASEASRPISGEERCSRCHRSREVASATHARPSKIEDSSFNRRSPNRANLIRAEYSWNAQQNPQREIESRKAKQSSQRQDERRRSLSSGKERTRSATASPGQRGQRGSSAVGSKPGADGLAPFTPLPAVRWPGRLRPALPRATLTHPQIHPHCLFCHKRIENDNAITS